MSRSLDLLTKVSLPVPQIPQHASRDPENGAMSALASIGILRSIGRRMVAIRSHPILRRREDRHYRYPHLRRTRISCLSYPHMCAPPAPIPRTELHPRSTRGEPRTARRLHLRKSRHSTRFNQLPPRLKAPLSSVNPSRLRRFPLPAQSLMRTTPPLLRSVGVLVASLLLPYIARVLPYLVNLAVLAMGIWTTDQTRNFPTLIRICRRSSSRGCHCLVLIGETQVTPRP